VASASWTWYLPPPSTLAKYNDAYPGCAKQLVDMAEAHARHRQALETKITDADAALRSRGQLFGFLLSLAVIIGGFIVIATGRSVEGFTAILLAFASLVGLFLYSRRSGEKELCRRRRPLIRRLPQTATRKPASSQRAAGTFVSRLCPAMSPFGSPVTRKTPPERGFQMVGAPGFEPGTSSPPD
jgi:uncharacterized membrane protein